MLAVRLFFLSFIMFSGEILAEVPSTQPKVAVEFLHQRKGSTSIPLVLFHLNDFPEKEMITLTVYRPLVDQSLTITNFTVDKQNRVHIGGSEKDCIELAAIGFLKGEPAIFSFESKNKTLVNVSVYPHLIAAENEDGDISIGAELIMLKPAVYRLHMGGIEDGETFALHSESCDEVINTKKAFSSNNWITISPDVIGKKGGIGVVTITVRDQKISIELPWGEALLDHALGLKHQSPKSEGLSF